MKCAREGCSNDVPPQRGPGRARKWCSDRCRKSLYDRACIDCGARVSGTDPNATNGRCRRCAGAFQRRATRQWLLDSVREWAETFGGPPGALDWSEALAIQHGRHDKVERKRSTGRPWPSPKAAAEHFGSWNAFIAAAGLKPTPAGRRHDESTRAYTRDALILAGREWAETHGRAPRPHEWKVGSDHPSATTVRKHFGSWAEFLAAVEAQAVEERVA
jgi:hypothetical protein